jgi:hypothetical protein
MKVWFGPLLTTAFLPNMLNRALDVVDERPDLGRDETGRCVDGMHVERSVFEIRHHPYQRAIPQIGVDLWELRTAEAEPSFQGLGQHEGIVRKEACLDGNEDWTRRADQWHRIPVWCAVEPHLPMTQKIIRGFGIAESFQIHRRGDQDAAHGAEASSDQA